VALVITSVSEELGVSFIRVTRIGEPILVTRATRRNIPEDAILRNGISSSQSLIRPVTVTELASNCKAGSAIKMIGDIRISQREYK
jgi:hypothetical protein